MNRYSQLLGIIQQEKPKTIVEVGTWNGDRALEMATQLIADDLPCHYIGFDLFEDATDETDAAELNVKKHFSYDEVSAKLDQFVEEFPGFTYEIYKGDTKETLNGINLSECDKPILGFIDGGHSCMTIAHDMKNLKDQCDYLILDDYYQADEDGKMPDIAKFGCNDVLESIGPVGEHWHIMPAYDRVKDGGYVQMVSVGRKFDIQISRKLEVQTKNAVSDDAIQRNVLYALAQDLPEVRRFYPHDGVCTFVSGGESFKEHLDQIREDQANGNFVVCVKTSHDPLIAAGIIPDACMLLDPRAHVTEFIEKPHPDVQYLAASQVYWETLRHLIKHEARVTLYHAMVRAGEEAMLGTDRFMILGGSTSATRGISVMHTLGFRHFRLFGYDSSFAEKPDDDYMEKYKDKQSKRPMKVKVLGGEFWTTPELIAQSKDFEQMISQASPNDAKLEVFGPAESKSLIQHMFEETYMPFQTWEWSPRKKLKAA